MKTDNSQTLINALERIKELEAELAQLKAVSEPVGYIDKKDLARLQDHVTWDGTHLYIGVDHFDQWLEDTPYDHLTPIYATPQPAPEVEALRKDAERYRLLRFRTSAERIELVRHVYDVDMDEAIDAAGVKTDE